MNLEVIKFGGSALATKKNFEELYYILNVTLNLFLIINFKYYIHS